ncbi:MAG: rod-binding protein [Sphingomonadales bacterium]|nr:MAG: rod-binding protein [Sphingomonadales bacterium]
MTQIPGPIVSTSGGVSNDTSRLASKENLEAAGQRFEAIFVGMMLKSMRSASLGEGLFDNKASQQFRDMQDDKLAQSMSTHTPLGIGKAMTEFLARAAGTEETAPATAAPEGSKTP